MSLSFFTLWSMFDCVCLVKAKYKSIDESTHISGAVMTPIVIQMLLFASVARLNCFVNEGMVKTKTERKQSPITIIAKVNICLLSVLTRMV